MDTIHIIKTTMDMDSLELPINQSNQRIANTARPLNAGSDMSVTTKRYRTIGARTNTGS